MAQLSAAQVAQHAYNAGPEWRNPVVLAQAVAYAWIESSFDSEAVSPTGCGGLWQLCPKPNGWSDPQTNANAAYAKWKACRGGSFACDWTPYDGGPNNPQWAEGLKQAEGAIKGGISGAESKISGTLTVPGKGLLTGKQVDPWGISQGIADFAGGGVSVAGGIGQHVQAGGTLLLGLGVVAGGLILITWLFMTRTQAGRQIGQATKRAAKDVTKAGVAVATVAVPK